MTILLNILQNMFVGADNASAQNLSALCQSLGGGADMTLAWTNADQPSASFVGMASYVFI